ncbi:MAG: glycosyltransferase family 4 protein [Acidimicrobiia bacterium]
MGKGTTERDSKAAPGSILILVSSTQRRGAEVFGELLSRALQQVGRQVTLLALHGSDSKAEIAANALFSASEIDDISGLKMGVVRRLRAAIREAKPALVFAGGGATLKYSVAAMAGMAKPRPALVYSSIGEPEFWATSLWRRRMMSALLARTSLVTAVSQATADQLVRSFGVSPAKIRVAHPGVPEEFLDIENEERGPGPLNILYLGSLSNEKNPMAAIAAVGLMECPAILRMVGDGPLRDSIEAESARSRFPLEVTGPADDVRDHLRWADAIVLTSRTEGLPGVVLEASAAGVPVVAFGVGGVSEAVEDGVTGYVIDPGDGKAMALALDRLARDEALRSSMAQSGRDRVRSHFLLSQALERYVAALDRFFAT